MASELGETSLMHCTPHREVLPPREAAVLWQPPQAALVPNEAAAGTDVSDLLAPMVGEWWIGGGASPSRIARGASTLSNFASSIVCAPLAIAGVATIAGCRARQ